MNKLTVSLCIGMSFCSVQSEATVCLGYFNNPSSIGISNQWGNQGDNFSSVNMKGNISWPSGKGSSLYKAPYDGVVGGNYSTYSIALPKRVWVNGVPLDISVSGRTPFNTPLNQDYNAWLVNTVTEGCRSGLNSGWNVVNNTAITGGNLSIILQGRGLPSGNYNLELPYTLAWGTDPNQSETERIKGTWAEINPINRTGVFDVSFTVTNKCDFLGEKDIRFEYGALLPDEVNGRKKEVNRKVSCLSSAEVSLSLSSKVIDLNNGVLAKIKIKNMNGNEIEKINVKDNDFTEFKIESELNVYNKITEGEFSGNSILLVNYN
jgi:hypothetical protein